MGMHCACSRPKRLSQFSGVLTYSPKSLVSSQGFLTYSHSSLFAALLGRCLSGYHLNLQLVRCIHIQLVRCSEATHIQLVRCTTACSLKPSKLILFTWIPP